MACCDLFDPCIVPSLSLQPFHLSLLHLVVSASEWSECVDSNTGYAYYWNTRTNEVRWEKPTTSTTAPSKPVAVSTPAPAPVPTPAPKESSFSASSSSRRQDPPSRSSEKSSSRSSRSSRSSQSRSRSRSPSRRSGSRDDRWDDRRDDRRDDLRSCYRSSSRNSRNGGGGSGRSSPRSPSTGGSSSSRRSSSKKPSGPKVFYGPSLPEPKPEEIAARKIKKLEEEMSDKVLGEIQRESPLDWKDAMPRCLHTKPFKWNQRKELLPTWKELSKEKSEDAKKPSNSIALIAGVYGDSDNEESEEEAEEDADTNTALAGTKRKMMQMQVKSLPAKASRTAVASAFADEGDEATETMDDNEKKSERRDKRGRRVYDSALGKNFELEIAFPLPPIFLVLSIYTAGPSFKKSIDEVAELLCEKLEALGVANAKVSTLKVLAIQVEVRIANLYHLYHNSLYIVFPLFVDQTLFAAWQSSALSAAYMQKAMVDLSRKMQRFETEELTPPGWRASWDRYEPISLSPLLPLLPLPPLPPRLPPPKGLLLCEKTKF